LTNITQRQPGALCQQAAEQHAGRGGESAYRAPDAERLVAVGALLEGGREDRERGGERHRGAEALREARADEHPRAAGESADQGRDPDHRYPGDEYAAAAKQVGGTSAEQHEAAVRQEVAARDPLKVLHRDVQVAADRGQGDVDDRSVDEVEEGDRRQQGQDELAATGREEGRLSGCGRHGGPFVCNVCLVRLTYNTRTVAYGNRIK